MIGKIISWNVRGVNNRGKRHIIRGCLAKWKPDIVCLQESKLEKCLDETIHSMWRLKEVGWHCIPANGTAGGIILM